MGAVKSFDTFGVIGPVIATGLDPMKLSVRTVLNGQERQNYPVADMFFPPHKLVARGVARHDADAGRHHRVRHLARRRRRCATPKNVVEIVIDGIGTLGNQFDQEPESPYLLGGAPKPHAASASSAPARSAA